MAGYPCLVRNPYSWLCALGLLLALSHSLEFGFLSIFLTSSAIVLYPVILCRSKQIPTPREQESSLQDNNKLSESLEEEEGSPMYAALPVPTPSVREHKTIEEQVAAVDEENVSKLQNLQKVEGKTGGEYLVRSSEELLSDSESGLDHTTSSEDSENDSIFRENLSHSTNYSDGSISDEESLIEIALPTGHYVDSKRSPQEQQSWYAGLQQKWPDCSLESHFRQKNWMEMLNEMNEENFIEIDLCMGSIKCSRFEIQA